MVNAQALLQAIAATLDGLDVAMCAFDERDCTLLWNRSFLRFFPEHAGQVHAGESYRANLRRFYEGRLDELQMASIDRYIDEGVTRHREQHRPFTFRHRGVLLRVASLPVPGLGRIRVWSREGLPLLSETAVNAALPRPEPAVDNAGLFEHVGDGVMLTNVDNRITWVNEHFVHMFALPGKASAMDADFESVYRSAWHDRADADHPLYERGLSALAENLRFAGAPFELPLPGNRWVRVSEQRRWDGVGFFAIIDISVLKRQQQELIAAERRARESQAELASKSRVLEATLERMVQGVMMVNADRVVEVCNLRAIELLGLPRDLMKSKPTFEQVIDYQWSTDEFAHLTPEFRALIRRGGLEAEEQNYERRRPNGLVIEIQSVPIEGGGLLRTYTDITERKRAEATQRALESQLHEAHKLEAIGTLAGGIAHDFNNIMAAILGNVAFAKESLAAELPAQVYLDHINRAGQRARSLVQQILAFSRNQAHEFAVHALEPLVEETMTMLRSTVGPQVALHSVLAGRPLAVLGNPTQIQQVLMNLSINAWQALQGAPGRIEIGIEEARFSADSPSSAPASLAPGAYARLWVRDDGVGMDEGTREHIFEPFFTTKPVGQGTGLGLAMAHGIVEAHRGAIAVDSALGQGSTFSLYLPLSEDVGPLPPLPRFAGEMADLQRGRGERVLYVDDDEVMTVMVQGLLQRLGYRTTCMLDARDAIAFVASDPWGIDLVVTDFNMPNLSGLDVVRSVAGIRASLPVVITSGYISDDLRAGAAALGVHAVMRKEHTLEELGPLIYAALHPLTR